MTVLIEDVDADWALDETPAGVQLRDRLAALMAAIERVTGAAVTGLAGSRDQLLGWRFDREVPAAPPPRLTSPRPDDHRGGRPQGGRRGTCTPGAAVGHAHPLRSSIHERDDCSR